MVAESGNTDFGSFDNFAFVFVIFKLITRKQFHYIFFDIGSYLFGRFSRFGFIDLYK